MNPIHGSDQNQADILEVRDTLLTLLVSRIRFLRESKKPKSYYAGEEYIQDKNQIDCHIRFSFLNPSLLQPTQFWYLGNRISVNVSPPLLVIEIHRKIPERLWDDLRWFGKGRNYIIGYANSVMPKVNRILLDNRYTSGHLLSRTYSINEAIELVVICKKTELHINWPTTVHPFPPSLELAENCDEIYLKDYVDAIHSYLKNDFDGCIRRLITSVESFFSFRKWIEKETYQSNNSSGFLQRLRKSFGTLFSFRKLNVKEDPKKFMRILYHNVKTDQLSGQVIVENLQVIYKMRNRIVHNGFRMSLDSDIFCDKAIATVRYLYQIYSGNKILSKYAYSLGLQLLLLQEIIGRSNNLDRIAMAHLKHKITKDNVIHNLAELDQFMFSTLRYTRKDIESIK